MSFSGYNFTFSAVLRRRCKAVFQSFLREREHSRVRGVRGAASVRREVANFAKSLTPKLSFFKERFSLLAPQLLKSAALLVTILVAMGTSKVVAQVTTLSQTSTLSQNYDTSDNFIFNQFNEHGLMNAINLVIVSSIDTGSFSVKNLTNAPERIKNPNDYLLITDNQSSSTIYTGALYTNLTTPGTTGLGYSLAGGATQTFVLTPKSLIGAGSNPPAVTIAITNSPFSSYIGTGSVGFIASNTPNLTVTGGAWDQNLNGWTNTTTVILNYIFTSYEYAQGALLNGGTITTNTVGNPSTATTVNLGARHTNNLSTNLVVSNSAVGDTNYVETLGAVFTSGANVNGTGSISGLVNGFSNSGMQVTLGNTNLGSNSGTIQMVYTSQTNANEAGLTDTSLGTNTLTVNAVIYSYAQATTLGSNPATNSFGGSNAVTVVDLGAQHRTNGGFTTNLAVSNSATGDINYVETLAAATTNGTNMGGGSFSGLAGGQTNGVSLTLTNTNGGTNSGTIQVVYTSQTNANEAGLSNTVIGTNTVTVTATV